MIAGSVLLALLLVAGTSDRTGRWGAALLAVLSIVWLVVNQPMEGAVLLAVAPTRGLTVADLTGFAGLGLAAWRFWMASR